MADTRGGGVSGDAAQPSKTIFGKYELGRLLGRGASAKVYHARRLPSGHAVAIKVFPNPRRPADPSPSSSAPYSDSFMREISALRRLRHPHIVRLHEVLATRSKIYLVLDLAKGGELFARVENRGHLPEELSRRYFRQLISAVAYSHSRGVFHRDLKPENLLLDESGDLRVSDFGFAALRPSSSSGGDLLHTQCGTPAYVAPEILSKKQTGGYDGAKSDIWSCGVILFVLNAGYLPFNDPNLMSLYRKIFRGHHRCPRWTSPELRRLISRLLDPDPATRISVDGILRDPWFARGLTGDQKAALMRPPLGDATKHQNTHGDTVLNAFDIISFSPGLDLSGLFREAVVDRERLAVLSPADRVVCRAEEVAKGAALAVRNEGKEGLSMVVEGHNGEFMLRLEVHRSTAGVTIVEVEKSGTAAASFWREKLRPALSGSAGELAQSPVPTSGLWCSESASNRIV